MNWESYDELDLWPRLFLMAEVLQIVRLGREGGPDSFTLISIWEAGPYLTVRPVLQGPCLHSQHSQGGVKYIRV